MCANTSVISEWLKSEIVINALGLKDSDFKLTEEKVATAVKEVLIEQIENIGNIDAKKFYSRKSILSAYGTLTKEKLENDKTFNTMFNRALVRQLMDCNFPSDISTEAEKICYIISQVCPEYAKSYKVNGDYVEKI